SCEPDPDILQAPEALRSLQEKYDRYKAEPETAASDTQNADPPAPGNEDVTIINNPKSSKSRVPHPSQNQSPPSTVISRKNGSRVALDDKKERSTRASDEGSNLGSKRNRVITQPSPSYSVHPPLKPKYAMYGDDGDDDEVDRSDLALVTEYRLSSNHSNGLDRPINKRAIEEQLQEGKRANNYINRGGYKSPSHNSYSSGGAANTSTVTSGNGTSPLKLKVGTKKFKSPLNNNSTADSTSDTKRRGSSKDANKSDELLDERLRNIDPKMVEAILNEMMESVPCVTWDDISGLEHAKKTVKETITWPMLRPDIFTGLRRPPKGLLLFGPPGTGKTMIGKCIASQSNASFFNISSSSLTSKWVGDGEKMVRALFTVARCYQPAVIFMDEVDSLLTQRSDGEMDASRRIKTEFLVQFDGVGAGEEDDRILIIGATNRPQEIDEAARRRFQKRLYIPLPEGPGRYSLMTKLLERQPHDLTQEQILDICDRTDGYSGSDVTGLCREAALGPVRAIQGDILDIDVDALRPINHGDFLEALLQVRASVSDRDLGLYKKWDMEYGSMAKG
ncbi:hypothetical protein BGZ65_003285, partial [Modicella reniformis]